MSERVVVENNFLGATSSDKRDKAIEKIKNGDRSLKTANKRSDVLMDKFRRDPTSLLASEQAELNTYVRVYAAEMESVHGVEAGQEMVRSLFANSGYENNPDTEALILAQSTVNTWGYHESNASIGNAPLATLSGGVLGTTVKEGMILNATIGTAINTAVQLKGPDPFSYVDAIMAGATSAAATGRGWRASMGINMGGAAIGSAIRGENPINSTLGAGAGYVIGGTGGIIVKGITSQIGKETISDLTGTVIGGYISEETSGSVKKTLDERDGANDKK